MLFSFQSDIFYFLQICVFIYLYSQELVQESVQWSFDCRENYYCDKLVAANISAQGLLMNRLKLNDTESMMVSSILFVEMAWFKF